MLGQRPDVLLECVCGCDGVDVEQELSSGQIRFQHLAAGREHQSVVSQDLGLPVGTRGGDFAGFGVDSVDPCANSFYADWLEHAIE